jgi:hypothetical protein
MLINKKLGIQYGSNQSTLNRTAESFNSQVKEGSITPSQAYSKVGLLSIGENTNDMQEALKQDYSRRIDKGSNSSKDHNRLDSEQTFAAASIRGSKSYLSTNAYNNYSTNPTVAAHQNYCGSFHVNSSVGSS